MKNISLNIDKALGTVSKEQVYAQEAKAMECIATLHNGNGAGNDFLGWVHLPSSITDTELADIENTANVLRSKCEVVVAIGIGGSYLGTKAVVEALNNSFDWLQNGRKNPVMLYAGHNIGEDYLYELSEVLKGKQFGIINISKSGTTTEPALAFRILKKQLEEVTSFAGCMGLYIWQFSDVRVSKEWAMKRPKSRNNKGLVDEYRRPKLAYQTVKEIFGSLPDYWEE